MAGTSLTHLFKRGEVLSLLNECGLACSYCGFPAAIDERVDLAKLAAEAQAIRDGGRTYVKLTGKDPGAHPQFDEVVDTLLRIFPRIGVQTTGLELHRDRGRLPGYGRVTWELPFVAVDSALHDAIVGRPGHHAVVRDLLLDPSLNVEANILLIRRVLEPVGFAALIAFLAKHGRTPILRFFTPRDTASTAYYADNVPSFQMLWSVIGQTFDEMQLRRFVEDNVECFPACTVPERLQPAFFQAHMAQLVPGSVKLDTPGIDDVLPCPHEARCAFGSECLGVHRVYTERHGGGEFRPEGIALSVLASQSSVARAHSASARAQVRPRNIARDHLAHKRWRAALRHLQPDACAATTDYGRRELSKLRRQAFSGLYDELKLQIRAGDLTTVDADLTLVGSYRGVEDTRPLLRTMEIGIHFERFQDALRRKDGPNAEAALRAVLEVDPGNAHANRELGGLTLKLRR